MRLLKDLYCSGGEDYVVGGNKIVFKAYYLQVIVLTDRKEVLSELSLLKDKLEKNRQLFDMAEDEAVIEALIYEERALMIRYSRLIRIMKGEE